jgi:hypothetical protein
MASFGCSVWNVRLREPDFAEGELEAVLAHFLPFSCTIKRKACSNERGYEFWMKEGSLEIIGSGFKQETKGGNTQTPLVDHDKIFSSFQCNFYLHYELLDL